MPQFFAAEQTKLFRLPNFGCSARCQITITAEPLIQTRLNRVSSAQKSSEMTQNLPHLGSSDPTGSEAADLFLIRPVLIISLDGDQRK